MNIVHYTGCWPTNIGNAFIDLGAKQLLKMAFPNSHVSFLSQYPSWVKEADKTLKMSSYLADIDLFTFGGCCLDSNDLLKIKETVDRLRVNNPNLKVLVLGAGVWNYSNSSSLKASAEALQLLNPSVFISRDSYSYKVGSFFKSYDGVDCGFFLNDYYTPPLFIKKLPLVYVGYHLEAYLPSKAIYVQHVQSANYVDDKINFISDVPEDYLTLYANAEKIISSRVHACVASICYDTPCIFKLDEASERGWLLFKKVGIDKTDTFFRANRDKLLEEKSKMVSFLKNSID